MMHIVDMASCHHTTSCQPGILVWRRALNATRKARAMPLWKRAHTLARAFLQLRQAFRVTDSGTRRRFDVLLPAFVAAVPMLPASISVSARRRGRGSLPVPSEVDWLGVD